MIGISASVHDFGDYGGVGVQRPLHRAGAVPLTLPQLPEAIDVLLDAIDGLVLAPGRDIEPALYGQQPHELLAATEPLRDTFELALVGPALQRRLPVLGICRGVQVLNVALGGTLHQDVSLVSPQHATDRGWLAWKRTEQATLAGEPTPPHPRHGLRLVPGTLLAEWSGAAELDVNSYHHQAIDQLGDGLTVSARSPDGLIEAIELPGRPALGVQWQLQDEARFDPRAQAVFEHFVAACGAR